MVESFSGDDSYLVDMEARTCTCPDNRFGGQTCKHLYAALLTEGEVRT